MVQVEMGVRLAQLRNAKDCRQQGLQQRRDPSREFSEETEPCQH